MSDKLTELRDGIAYIDAELRNIHESAGDEPLDADTQARFDAGLAERDDLAAKADAYEARLAAAERIGQRPTTHEAGSAPEATRDAPAFHRDVNPYDAEYQREVGTREAALRAIGECRQVDGDAQTEMESKLRRSATDPHLRRFDEYILRHNSEEYSRGVIKLINGRGWEMSPSEVQAVRETQAWDEERGLTLTAANGGALIPAHLDPTVILTNTGVNNPFRMISRVVPVMSNVWNGVTSAGVTMAWSTEGGDSSDVAPTFGQPSVTCHKAHGTVPVTIEAFEDIQGLGSEVARLIQDGKDTLESAAFVKGSGSGQPYGIVTRLYADPDLWDSHATNGAFTVTDLIDAQNALAPRFQPNASWVSSLAYQNRVRAFGATYFDRTVTLDRPVSADILGKPSYEASDMSTALSTTTNPAMVYGDFSGYVIADRIGLAVEFIPNLVSAGNALPNGKRGWYAYWRTGADVVSYSNFVLSVNPAVTG